MDRNHRLLGSKRSQRASDANNGRCVVAVEARTPNIAARNASSRHHLQAILGPAVAGVMVSAFCIPTAFSAPINWTSGTSGDASGTWSSTIFNGQSYASTDDLSIDGVNTKTITLSGAVTPNSLSITGTTSGTDSYTTPAGSPGTGAITLTGTSIGGTLNKTGSADLVLATANTFKYGHAQQWQVFSQQRCRPGNKRYAECQQWCRQRCDGQLRHHR